METDRSAKPLSRRDFLIQSTAATLGVLGAGCQSLPGKSKPLPVGLQLYSVRAECAKDLPGTIEKVAEIGYDGVEFAGYYDHSAPDIRKMLDDNGLVCCGTHTAMDTLADENLEATIEFNQILGNRYLIVPWLKPSDTDPLEQWHRYADRFNVLADKVKPHQMVVGYHCHAHDFHAIEGQVPWDVLFGNTGPGVVMQIDTCNAMSGGADPVAYLKKYPGRSHTVHIKEWSDTKKDALLGEGDVNWDQVFEVCETTGGTQWYIIEEEKDAYAPLTAVDLCLQYYRKLRA